MKPPVLIGGRLVLCSLIVLAVASSTFSQQSDPDNSADSSAHFENYTIADSAELMTLTQTAHAHMYNDVVEATRLSLEALKMAQKVKYIHGHVAALALLGESLCLGGNYSKGLETSLKAVEIAEDKGDGQDKLLAYLKLGAVNDLFGDHQTAIKYYRESMDYTVPTDKVPYGLLGEAFTKLNVLDSAMYYSQRAYELDIMDKSHWAVPYLNLGRIHQKMKHHRLALEFYRSVLSLRLFTLDSIAAQLGMADVFQQLQQHDSVMYHARQAATMAQLRGYPEYVAEANVLIKDIFKKQNNFDSAFLYQEYILEAKHQMYAQDKLNEIRTLQLNQQLKEIESQEEAEKELLLRKNDLQFGAIALGIVIFVLLFFTLSSSFMVTEKFIRFFGIIALLLLFEFVNLFVHPHISNLTHHSPIWMLLIMVCIAALLVPAHHRLENWIKHRLVEKNKKIRLIAAKKTIQTLEGQSKPVE
jgi:tetratricopeptide (TPR) repeat protein